MAEIVENADRIDTYLTGMDRAAFAQDGLRRDAVERCLERICEAAHRLGERAAELMPDQPWGDILGMGVPGLAMDVRRALARLSKQELG